VSIFGGSFLYAEAKSVRTFKRGLETMATPICFGCSWKITLVLLGEYNFGIRIGSKGWVSWAGA
jgi:hypothetical protein